MSFNLIILSTMTTTYRETYRAAMFIVDMAMIYPIIPTKRGTVICQNLSPCMSECLPKEK